MTATASVPFVSAETKCYNDYVKDCVNFYNYQVRYNYEIDGVKFAHEYRVFDKDEIENLNVVPGYVSFEVTEYTPENATFEIPDGMMQKYKDTLTEAFNTLSYYVAIYFFDENGKEIYETHTYDLDEAQKIVDEYDGEYATYNIEPYLLGVKPNGNDTKPCDTLSDASFKEVSLEYTDENGGLVSFIDYTLINEDVYKNIMEQASVPVENSTGYRVALYDDIEEYMSVFRKYTNDDVVQEVEYLLGDINDDKLADLTDLTCLSIYLLGDCEFDEREYASADVQNDGVVNIADLATFKAAITSPPVLS